MEIHIDFTGGHSISGRLVLDQIPLDYISKVCEEIPKIVLEQYILSRLPELQILYGKKWANSLLEVIKGMKPEEAIKKVVKEEEKARSTSKPYSTQELPEVAKD